MVPSGKLHPSSNSNPLAVALGVSVCAALLSYVLPPTYAATGVGLWFLTATYLLALRGAPGGAVPDARRWGLSLGGLLDPPDKGPLSPRQLARDTGRAAGLAALVALLTFPPFWLGFRLWYDIELPFAMRPWEGLGDEALGQLLVIALPEEAFFRGYLQTALEERWPPRRRFLGAPVGWALVVSSAVFALGHLATAPDPGRLAVFFPSLVFGWLRARTGGIGAGSAYHAACNLFASFLARGYGLLP